MSAQEMERTTDTSGFDYGDLGGLQEESYCIAKLSGVLFCAKGR